MWKKCDEKANGLSMKLMSLIEKYKANSSGEILLRYVSKNKQRISSEENKEILSGFS